MAVSIEDNDTAYVAVETAILKLADILECTYIDTNTSQQAARTPGPLQRYLFRTLPHALAIFAFEDVHIVCVSDMSSMTFWEYVNERFGTEREPIPKAKGVEITLDSTLLARKAIRLPNNLNMTISYARVFQGQCFRENSFLVTEAAANKHCVPLARVYDVQHLSAAVAKRNSLTLFFSNNYVKFRHWAFCSGILSRGLGYLSEENLQHVLASSLAELESSPGLAPSRIFEALIKNVRLHRNFYGPMELVISPSGRTISSQQSAGSSHAIERTIARAPSKEDPPHWLAAAWDNFTTEHNVFVQLQVRYWNSKQQQEAIDMLCDTALGLRAHMTKEAVWTGCRSARVWPHIDRGIPSGEDEASLLVGIMSSDDGTRRQFVDDFLEQVQYDTSAFFVSHVTLTKGQLPTASLPLSADSIEMPSMDAGGPAHQSTSTQAAGNGRFRTAGGVMERLRHDPAHRNHDYEVGYVDRFEKDLIWKPLEKWEKMTEEEEFVPEHRVRQVRRKVDGMIMWDREKRLDRSDET